MTTEQAPDAVDWRRRAIEAEANDKASREFLAASHRRWVAAEIRAGAAEDKLEAAESAAITLRRECDAHVEEIKNLRCEAAITERQIADLRATKAKGLRASKGRTVRPPRDEREVAHCRGEDHGSAKLTIKQVASIRSDGRLLREIADDFGVDITTVSRIRRGKLWNSALIAREASHDR